jgi:2-polyprenyl-3-methyl-5-hydroxy-6-metoxy-1,4-benzoquinol methylase
MNNAHDLYDGYAQAKQWHDQNFGKISDAERHYLRSEITRHQLALGGRRVLEIGFGNVSFLRFARDEGADAVGIEIQDDLLKLAAENGFEAYSTIDALRMRNIGQPFALIAAFDVLEHLTPAEAIEMLRKLRDLADLSEGILLARFPNGDSPLSLPIQNGDFTHRTALGAGIVKQILQRSGWKLAYLGEPTWAFSSMRDRLVGGTRHLLRRSLEGVLLSVFYGRGGPPTLYHNYILVAKPALPQ